MAKTKPFVFKREPLGRFDKVRGVAPSVAVKQGGRDVGMIYPPRSDVKASGGPGWNVRLMVKVDPTEQYPAPFEWRDLGRHFESEAAAKDWLHENIEAVLADFDLYALEP
jgi:hypothetical protein